jgi:LysM repeat protein
VRRPVAVVHTVRPGEGFSIIARRYHVGAARLARANGLRLSSVITPGQRLRVPGRAATVSRPRARTAPVFHVVRAGEGFFSIAERYHLQPLTLARGNGLVLSSVLTPGQRLRVPGRTIRLSTPVPRTAPTQSGPRHTVGVGESFFSIAQRYHVSPWRLARVNKLSLMATIVPGQRLTLPSGAHLGSTGAAVAPGTVRAALDRWSRAYGVDPKLARAVAWMESGFQQDVVSSAGAIGVMQLLPETWEWVDTLLLGEVTPRNYDGNVRAGVRYLRWQLDEFDGDVRLALAGYYQGARAVRERGLFEDTKQYVSVILGLYGSV